MAKVSEQPSIFALEDKRDRRQAIKPQRPDRNKRAKFAGMKPETLSSVLSAAEKGRIEKFADLCAVMRRDHHVRAVTDTFALAISGAATEITPADDTPLADAASEFCRHEIETSKGWQSLVEHLLTGEDVGWAAGQHVWSRRDGEWHSDPETIESRDVSFAKDWTLLFRTYDDLSDNGEWIQQDDIALRTIIPHVPNKGMRPTIAGDFHAIAWPWLFRRWCELFRQEGLEKFASPFITGKVPPNSTDVVRDRLKSALENLSSDQIAVMEDGSSIEFTESAQRPGDAWSEAIQNWNDQITKVKLGSTLNTEVGNTGGNRALGESQFSTTTLPRLEAAAARVARTVERYWFRPLLELNAHRFGGAVPPVPKLTFRIVSEDGPDAIAPADVTSGLRVRQNEWRASIGLDPLSVEDGGEEFVVPPPAPGAPAFESAPASRVESAPRVTGGEEVAQAPVPFGRLSRLPLLAQASFRPAKTTLISSTSATHKKKTPEST